MRSIASISNAAPITQHPLIAEIRTAERGLALARTKLKRLQPAMQMWSQEDAMTLRCKHHVFHSTLTRGAGWVVKEGGETVSRHASQQECEAAAIAEARQFGDEGGLGQAVLHQSDGSIREERTFGNDP